MKNVRGYKIIKIADSLSVCVHDCHPSAVLVGMIKTSCISETPLVLNNYLFNYWTGHDSNNERLIPRAGHFDHYHYEFTSFSQFECRVVNYRVVHQRHYKMTKRYEHIKDNKRTYKMI